MRVLKRGCVGRDVEYLQYRLNIVLPNLEPLKVDGDFGRLTEDRVKYYQTSVKLKDDGKAGPLTQKSLGISDFIVWILDPKKDKLWVAGTPYGAKVKPLKTLEQWAKEENADEVWNLAFFNREGQGSDKYGVIKGRTLTYVRAKGYDVGYGGTVDKVTLDSNNVFAGYKLAVKNGDRCKVSSSGRRARNANGILEDGRIFIVQSITAQTEYAMVSHMIKNYDVELMLIQDAGGSTGYFNRKHGVLLAGEKEGRDGRPVATVICAKLNGR